MLYFDHNINHMGKFKRGLFLGALLGAGSVWMNTTKRGREIRDQIIDAAADAYVKLKKELLDSKRVKELTKHEYVKKVDTFVTAYARKHKMQAEVANRVKKILVAQFKRMKADLQK